ncbi:MAG: isochorismatase family protein [Finegoldia sp.]|nr:isochorismatase family protein [Finegoldia sp.]
MAKDISKFYLGKFDKKSKSYDLKNTALLVIDLQEKLLPQIDESKKLINNTQAALKVANLYNMKTLATEQYSHGLGRTVDPILEFLNQKDIFEKTAFNAYIKDVRSFLKENEIENVIVTGAEAHICVYQTVRSLLKDGYKVFIVKDAISAYDNEKKEEAIKLMEKMGAISILTEMFIYDLLGDSKSENFKEVTAIIKELRKDNK